MWVLGSAALLGLIAWGAMTPTEPTPEERDLTSQLRQDGYTVESVRMGDSSIDVTITGTPSAATELCNRLVAQFDVVTWSRYGGSGTEKPSVGVTYGDPPFPAAVRSRDGEACD